MGVVATMLLMATVGLVFALATKGYRRMVDQGLPERPKRNPQVQDPEPRVMVPSQTPRELIGLRYVPGDARLLAGIRVVELQQDRLGNKLLDGPLPAGLPGRIKDLENATGVPLDQIDHVVIAAWQDGDQLLPRFVLVVRGRAPLDQAKIRDRLHARPDGPEASDLYHVPGSDLLKDGVFLCSIDDRTLLFALKREDLSGDARKPHPDLTHLHPPLRELLEERMRQAGPVWLVVSDIDWSKLSGWLLIAGLNRPEVTNLRAFGLWLSFETRLTLWGELRCADAETAPKLEALLREKLPGGAKAIKSSVKDDWLSLQWRESR
jgi:hypothetical protein